MRRLLLAFLVAIAALLLVLAVASLWWPYGSDQAWLGWVADVIRSGGRPYVNAWDNNSPGAPLQQAALLALFGRAEWPLRALDLVYLGLTCWALVALGRRLFSRQAGLWAAAIFALGYESTGNGSTAQRDGYGAMLATWALALIGTGGLGATALAGALLGVATLMKPVFALLLVPAVALAVEVRGTAAGTAGEAVSEGRPSRARLPVAHVAALLGLFALPLAAAAAWLAPGGGLLEGYRDVVLFNLHSYTAAPGAHPQSFTAALAAHLLPMLPLLALAAVGAAYVLASRARGRWSFAVLWPLSAAAAVLVQRRLLVHYWHTLLAPLALLGGIGILWLAARASAPDRDGSPASASSRARRGRRGLAVLTFALVLGAFFQPCRLSRVLVRYWLVTHFGSQEARSHLTRYDRPYDGGGYRILGVWLAAHTQPGEPVQVWSSRPSAYFYAQRPCATRFGYNWPLLRTAHTLPRLHRAYEAEFLRQLEAARPRYFAADTNPDSRLALDPAVEHYVMAHYRQCATVASFRVFALDRPTAAARPVLPTSSTSRVRDGRARGEPRPRPTGPSRARQG